MKKNNQIAVIGGGGHAGVVLSILKLAGEYEIAGYTDNIDRGSLVGIKYLGKDEAITVLNIPYAAIGITYLESPKDTGLRKKLIEKFSNSGVTFPSVISSSAVISYNVRIAMGTVVNTGAIINNDSTIGEFAVVNTGAIIEHNCIIGDHCIISPGAIICGSVTIGRNVFVGAGAIIRDAVTIADDTVIGAGANITANITNAGVYLGNPGKIFL